MKTNSSAPNLPRTPILVGFRSGFARIQKSVVEVRKSGRRRQGGGFARFINQNVEATVLMGKGKFWIFKEAVHEDDEFAHDGGHGDEGFLAVGPEPQINFLEDVVVADGT